MARRRKPYRRKKLPGIISLLVVMLAAGVLIVGCQRWLTVNDRQSAASSSAPDQKQVFIARLAPYAQELQATYGVLPSITLAQAILESDWGESQLATDYHNLFGIKSDDPIASQLMTTQEYVNDEWVTVKARFATYPSDQASMRAHALLFVNGTQWNANQYQDVLNANGYREAAQALKIDGYATDPGYPEKLINLIETYQLDRFDSATN